MKKIAILFLAGFLLTGTFILESCQSTKSSTASKMLKFNFEKGKGYDYEMTTSIDQEVPGLSGGMGMDMTAYYSMMVEDDNGTEKTISSTFDRVKINMDAGGFKIDVDTDKPMATTSDTDNEMNKAMGMINNLFGAIKGRQFKMKVNAEGKVTDVTGFDEMAESIVNSVGEEMPEEEKEKMRQQFSSQFSDEKFKSQFERLFYIFPNKEVKLGDSWDRNTTVTEGGMDMNYKSTYKVSEIEGDMVTLEEKSDIKSNKDEMDLDGKVKGTIVVDSRSGLIVSSNQDMSMTITAGGQKMSTKAITRIKGKLL